MRRVPLSLRVWLVLLRYIASSFRPADSQLSSVPPNTGVFNPFAGQGHPPDQIPSNEYPVFPLLGNPTILNIDEERYTAELLIWWTVTYNDSRALAIFNQEYDTCDLYCASRQMSVTNKQGLPACCTGIFVPAAEATNARGYAVQDWPHTYSIYMIGEQTVNAFSAFVGTFAFAWDLAAFPFDKHQIIIDLQTSFRPMLSHSAPKAFSGVGATFTSVDGFVIPPNQSTTSNPQNFDDYRPAVTNQATSGWLIDSMYMEVLEVTSKYFSSGSDVRENPYGQDTPLPPVLGIRTYIKIKRQTVGYYITVTLLPPALITIFSFSAQSLRRDTVKGRVELLTIFFLSLVLLQFVLQGALPATYRLSLPFIMILLGYIYSFLLFIVFIATAALEQQWRRRQLKYARMRAATNFSKWAAELRAGPFLNLSSPPLLTKEEQVISIDGAPPAEEEDSIKAPHLRNSKAVNSGALRQHDETGCDMKWLAKQRAAWYFRVRALRTVAEWWRFIGKPESKEYCIMIAHQFDKSARLFLLLSYLVIMVCLAVSTASQANYAANHVLSV